MNNIISNFVRYCYNLIIAVPIFSKKLLVFLHYHLPDKKDDNNDTYRRNEYYRQTEKVSLIAYGVYSAIYYILTISTLWGANKIQSISFWLWILAVLIVALEHFVQVRMGFRVNDEILCIQHIKQTFHSEIYSNAIILHICMMCMIICMYMMCVQVYQYVHICFKLLVYLSGFLIWADLFIQKLAKYYDAQDIYDDNCVTNNRKGE